MAPKAPKFELKTPKGTKDWEGKDMVIRDKIFSTITEVFKRHGGVTIDTPVFELREILAGKYGEDSKLIYDLADQGGEICSLRYDLTVPFARWLAMNKDVQQIKRYHIAKVYRRDQPAMTKGRMREFYQCDFDIAGALFDPMLPDAEVIRIINEVFEALGWQGTFTIKLNHRKILDGIFEVCGVPEDKIRTISSAVDKLDKLPWADVRKEMTEEKGLDAEAADRIGEWVTLKGKRDLLEKLRADEKLSANASMKQGMDDLELLFDYLEYFNALDTVSFDLSLARGLDYYTGVIYEVVTEGSAPSKAPAAEEVQPAPKKKGKKGPTDPDDDRSNDPSIGVGSIAAGGRYDNLVGMFSGKNQVPCVGISFGVDRIFSITKARMEADKNAAAVRRNEVDVYVMAFGAGPDFKGLIKERMSVCASLWEAGIKAEFLYKVKPRLQNQFKAAENNGVPFAVVLGEGELANGQVKIKEMGLNDGHPEKEGVLVSLANVAEEVKQRLQRKKALDGLTMKAEGLRVVHGIRGEEITPGEAAAAVEQAAPVDGGKQEETQQ
ncbi:Cytoplasmic and mitochondrial histidine tRNA synthetase [Pestalotiopsis sp. 9143b]|nr:Cytoplasmic and mitochondrial histidine tRNA synthetase [Pestalotiopsis sp. 9143b]